MSTKPVNNVSSGVPSPGVPSLGMDRGQNAGKAGDAAKIAGAAAPLPQGVTKGAAQGGSAVRISDAAKDRAEAYQKAFDIAKNTPDVREDRVAAIKAQLAAGTYQIDSGKIADGMMREAIIEHLAETEEH